MLFRSFASMFALDRHLFYKLCVWVHFEMAWVTKSSCFLFENFDFEKLIKKVYWIKNHGLENVIGLQIWQMIFLLGFLKYFEKENRQIFWTVTLWKSPSICGTHHNHNNVDFWKPLSIYDLDRGDPMIHKSCDQFFGHFWPPPPSWTNLPNKANVEIWTFG